MTSALAAVFAAADERRDVQEPLRLLARRTGWLSYHAYRSDKSEAGFPDLVLVTRRPRRGRPWLLFLECKRERGRLTVQQAVWAAALEAVEVATGGLVVYRTVRPSSRWEVEALLAGTREAAS